MGEVVRDEAEVQPYVRRLIDLSRQSDVDIDKLPLSAD
jgi:hypothetical protein